MTLEAAVSAGVDGFLDKDLPVGSIVASVHAVLSGVFVNSPRHVTRLRESVVTPVPEGICADETDREILRMVKQGRGYVEIAAASGISEWVC